MALSNNPLLVPPVIPTPAPSSGRMSSASLNNTPGMNTTTAAAPQCNIFWVKNMGLMPKKICPKLILMLILRVIYLNSKKIFHIHNIKLP